MADTTAIVPAPALSTRLQLAKVIAVLGTCGFIPLFFAARTEWGWADESDIVGIVVAIPEPDQFVCRLPSHPELGLQRVTSGELALRASIGDSVTLRYSPTHAERVRYVGPRRHRLSNPMLALLETILGCILFGATVGALYMLRSSRTPRPLVTTDPSA